MTACYHVSSHQGLPPGLALIIYAAQRPSRARLGRNRAKDVEPFGAGLHASKARGVRGDPGYATIEMGSIGRSTAAVSPFRLASPAALARPPTSPPPADSTKARQLLQVCTPMARGCWRYRADGRHSLGLLFALLDGRPSAFAFSSSAASASFPVAALLRYIWFLAPTHAALIGQNRSRT